jgi:hypothetical protein
MDPAEEVGKSTVEHWERCSRPRWSEPVGLPDAWRARRVNAAAALHAGWHRRAHVRPRLDHRSADRSVGHRRHPDVRRVRPAGMACGDVGGQRWGLGSWTMAVPSPTSICHDARGLIGIGRSDTERRLRVRHGSGGGCPATASRGHSGLVWQALVPPQLPAGPWTALSESLRVGVGHVTGGVGGGRGGISRRRGTDGGSSRRPPREHGTLDFLFITALLSYLHTSDAPVFGIPWGCPYGRRGLSFWASLPSRGGRGRRSPYTPTRVIGACRTPADAGRLPRYPRGAPRR